MGINKLIGVTCLRRNLVSSECFRRGPSSQRDHSIVAKALYRNNERSRVIKEKYEL
jgi:hypothetical protein